jgi:MFS family permease
MNGPLRGLPPTPRRLAWLHFANDFTLDFLTPLLPSGVPVAWLGAMEGAADAVAQALKIVTGRRSDASGRRVGWVRAGYGLNAVMRPLASVGLFLAMPALIVACRIGDRIGKGVRGSAADALVADWTSGDQRAVAYAAMRTMDHLGATLGALAAAVAMYCFPWAVGWAVAALVVPAMLMAWWAGGLRDAPDAKPKDGAAPGYWPRERALQLPLLIVGASSLGAKIGPLLVLVVVTGLPLDGRGAAPWPLWQTCLGWAVLGLVQAGAAAFAGAMTVRLGARAFLVAGWLAGAAVFAALAFVHGWALIAAGLAYGALSGFTEGAEKTWISELTPKSERAVAFGALGLLVAGGTLAGNALVGFGLSRIGTVVLAAPSAVLLVAALALLMVRRAPAA